MPWPALMRLSAAHARQDREDQLRLAVAVRVGSLADDSGWDEFVASATGGQSRWDRMHALNERALARRAEGAEAGRPSDAPAAEEAQ